MEFVSLIVTPIVESLLVPVKRHLGFLVSSTSNVRDMRARMTVLNNAAKDMEIKKESNDANNLVVPHHVPGWLAQVKTINDEAEGIQSGGNGCFNMKAKYKAGKRSSDILMEIDRLINEKDGIEWTDDQIPLGMVNSKSASTSELVDEGNQSRIKSRDLLFGDALKSLEPNNIDAQKIALCGMGGVGKTTMMEQLKKAVEDKKMFDWIVKVVIGRNQNPINVQQTVAEYIGRPLTETDKETRAERLKNRFEGMLDDGKKNILVILDDVWEEVDLSDIGLMSPLPKGIKLLLTSREEDVCIRMGVEYSSIFRMVVFEEPEARRLFWEIARPVSDGDIDPDLQEIGEDIVKRCGGLPIAIKTIASTLRYNIKDAWKDALLRLENKRYHSLDNIFDISYNNLKEDGDKATFILTGMFPDDSYIPIEDLVRYGWGLKLFKDVSTIATARHRVNTCVNNLVRSNLLIKSDREGCLKMHDLVRDFVLSNFSKVKQASIVNSDDFSEQLTEEYYERVLLKCTDMSEFPIDLNYSNLALLKLIDGDELFKFPQDFYTRMEKLEVVVYETMHQPLLPQYSTSLRTLCLHSCTLVDDFSFLGDLINLEVLSFANCGIRKLPSALGKLKRLKLLDLTGCVDLSIDDGVFQNIHKLRELYMRACEGKAIRFTDANCNELEMLSRKLTALEIELFETKVQAKQMSFNKLELFKISIGCRLEDKEDDVRSYKNTLKLRINRSELLECKVNELFKKTEILHFEVNDMNHLEEFSTHPSQHTFCNLQVLSVSNCVNVTYLFTVPVASGLMKLETLVISGCPVMETLVGGSYGGAGVIKFPKLKVLSLYNLPELVSLCDSVNVMALPQLVELDLYELPNITCIFPGNTSMSGMQPLMNSEVLTLEKLRVQMMKKLKELWPYEIPSSSFEEEVNDKVTMLREIAVEGCDSLVNLFPSNPMQLLSHLEELHVRNCGSVEVLFNMDMGCHGKIKHVSSSRLRSIYLKNLENLTELCKIRNVNNSGLIFCGFQAVESIYILSCENFRNIMTPTTASFDMRALINITIISCAEKSSRNNELVKNGQEQEINEMSEEEMTLKGPDNTSTVVFPSCTAQSFQQLRKVSFNICNQVEVVFATPSNREVVTTQQPLVLHPCDLSFEYMERMTHVWDCNWNKYLILQKNQPQSLIFHNLTKIFLKSCGSIKYLFSPVMVKLLLNIKQVAIHNCDSMEQVVSNRDNEDDEEKTTFNHTSFPCLDYLSLHSLSNLKYIGGGVPEGTTNVIHDQSKFFQADVVSWSLGQFSRKIIIWGCKALSSVIPCYAAGQMQTVEELDLWGCGSMTEIFETKEIRFHSTSIDEGSGGTEATALTIPRPKYVTTHKLSNLKKMRIVSCNLLEYIFTFSTIESLRNLEELTIEGCMALKVIVREENGEQTTTSEVVVFPRLRSIKLLTLPHLAGFYLGMNDFQWPLLDYVMIKDCPKTTVFTSGESTTPKLNHIDTELGKYVLERGLNFHVTPALHLTPSPSCLSTSSSPTASGMTFRSFDNLIDVNVEYNQNITHIISSKELLQLHKLETIHVSCCHYVEEIFELPSEVTNSSFNESKTVVISKLRQMYMKWLDSLRYIWKSNQRCILKFPSLTRLTINGCKSLEYVLTCSMLGSLMQLQGLDITFCQKMEVIVKEEEEEACDAKAMEIEFPCLKYLCLKNLSCLKGFYLGKANVSFPSLDSLEVNYCGITLKNFTKGHCVVPELKWIITMLNSSDEEEDLSCFIMTQKPERMIVYD